MKSNYRLRQRSVDPAPPVTSLSLQQVCREILETAVEDACRAMVSSLLCASAESITGPHRQGKKAASGFVRYGSQPGAVYIGRHKIRVERPRVRGADGKEAKIPVYECLRSSQEACKKIHDAVIAGVSTRRYDRAVQDSLEAVGCSKSTVSRRFIEESSRRMETFLSRPVPEDLVVLMLDGIRMGDYLVVVGVGIDSAGVKHALSLDEGSTENAATVKRLLLSLVERGLNVNRKLLFVVDGSKALSCAIHQVCGTHHPIQRCRVHKARNVLEKLPSSKQRYVRAAMTAAWRLSADSGIKKMKDLAQELEVSHFEASRSLLEGLELTFTLQRLKLPPLLVSSLGSTNIIENAQGSVRAATRRITHFKTPEDARRWAASAMIHAQEKFSVLQGFRNLWMLQAALGHEIAEGEDKAS